MKLTPSRAAFLFSIVLIIVAVFTKTGQYRLAVDRDDWVRNDTTLTAHTVYSPEDSIYLECPPPWVKWYKVDFTGPETGECVFADLGLMADTSWDAIEYVCPALLRVKGETFAGPRSKLIASVTWRFIPDPKTRELAGNAHFELYIIVNKNKSFEHINSRKMYLLNKLQEQATLPRDSIAHWYDTLPESIDKYYYQHSDAGSYEKHIMPENPAPGHPNTRYWHYGPEWSKGLWRTRIAYYCYDHESRLAAIRLDDRIPALVMQYYRDLNRRYGEGSL